MKKAVTMTVAGLMVGVLASPVLVAAQTTQDVQATSEPTTSSQTRESRIAENKQALQQKLDAAQLARTTAACTKAQALLQGRIEILAAAKERRVTVYSALVQRLTNLRNSLEAQEIDTAELNGHIEELQRLITQFTSELETHTTSVSDAANLDCAADPEAFRATLSVVQTSRKEVAAAAIEIKNYTKDTVRPYLAALKAQIATPAPSENQLQSEGQ